MTETHEHSRQRTQRSERGDGPRRRSWITIGTAESKGRPQLELLVPIEKPVWDVHILFSEGHRPALVE